MLTPNHTFSESSRPDVFNAGRFGTGTVLGLEISGMGKSAPGGVIVYRTASTTPCNAVVMPQSC